MQNELENKNSLWSKVWKKNKLKKPKSVAVIYLREDGSAEPMEVQTRRGFFEINGRTYHERRDCTYTLVGKERFPFAIIPEWNLTPLGTKEWNDREPQDKCSKLQDHAMQGIRHAERVRLGEKMGGMQMNTKTIVVLGIVAIIVIAFITSYV